MSCTKHFQQLKAEIKSAALKITSSRLAVLEVLAHAKQPLSVEAIGHKIKNKNLATIYRGVRVLQKKNLVSQIALGRDRGYYEFCPGRRHHHHLVCERCGKIVGFGACALKRLEKTLARKNHFYSISRHSLEFFGLCQKCVKAS